jgi:hypothetical protein
MYHIEMEMSLEAMSAGALATGIQRSGTPLSCCPDIYCEASRYT